MSWRIVFWLLVLACAATVPARTGEAPSPPSQAAATQRYPSGWNLAAFPQGTSLPGISPLYSLPAGASGYQTVVPAQGTTTGSGYWAYFVSDTTIALAAGGTSAIQVTAPPGQWLMVGDPSGVMPAAVSGADVVYVYSPASGYAPSSSLNPGQGAWIFSHSGATVTITPTATQAPQWGDSRFGVTLAGDPQQLVTLGTPWFITYTKTLDLVPAGAVWVQYIPLLTGQPIPSDTAQRVRQWPGSYWLIGNEPNVTGSPNQLSGDQFARDLHDVTTIIKGTDPSAKIIGPNIINWDFTCLDCPGYTSGHTWTDAFLTAYQADYGVLPPIDVWAIHTYPLDWDNFPQVNAGIVEDQLTELRQYLNSKPGLAGAPIWVTELGTHWGFQGIDWHDDGTGTVKAFPVGTYQTSAMLSYEQNVLDWLTANAQAQRIDRWFFFATYVNQPEPWETVYGGIDLVDGAGPDANLTPFGQLYRQHAGLSP